MQKLISWVEIPTTDFDRAVDFYNAVFELNMQKMDFGHEKMACFPNDEGAISYAAGFEPGKAGLLVSFNAGDDLEGMMVRIRQHGGEILQDKTKIEAENRGYFALFLDSEGNKVGLYGN